MVVPLLTYIGLRGILDSRSVALPESVPFTMLDSYLFRGQPREPKHCADVQLMRFNSYTRSVELILSHTIVTNSDVAPLLGCYYRDSEVLKIFNYGGGDPLIYFYPHQKRVESDSLPSPCRGIDAYAAIGPRKFRGLFCLGSEWLSAVWDLDLGWLQLEENTPYQNLMSCVFSPNCPYYIERKVDPHTNQVLLLSLFSLTLFLILSFSLLHSHTLLLASIFLL